ncbi:hypothetical protein CYMTET_28957 [Cymbomonas tetramitiformis]|uniref:Uncharacterized protein n=1 Tax=Cymbomonas tetramitiformis TaxID=36881 RepID=A0AAE0KVD8_9CHLO|nr:hypothetical protein CYMTET_28957 [Cymbomonas tetramitiformis]
MHRPGRGRAADHGVALVLVVSQRPVRLLLGGELGGLAHAEGASAGGWRVGQQRVVAASGNWPFRARGSLAQRSRASCGLRRWLAGASIWVRLLRVVHWLWDARRGWWVRKSEMCASGNGCTGSEMGTGWASCAGRGAGRRLCGAHQLWERLPRFMRQL